MITPDYFSLRWSWYRPILDRGEDPAGRCRIDVRRLPLRVAGTDAREYIPFALHPQLAATLSQSLASLQEYAERYLVKGEKVSAHQLPKTDAESRAVIEMLRAAYPHLPRTLLHHWCAEPKGAPALLGLWREWWTRGWQQEQADTAPWVTAVNVLALRLMREALSKLPQTHAEQISHAMLCMLGGLYQWALMAFLKEHADGAVELIRIHAYESMVLPATPIAFMLNQADDALLGDDRQTILAYGLEPDLVPRMREMRRRLGPRNEAGMLALLGKDKLSAHLLRRSWARLALWDLAVKTGEGAWMRWVLNAKALDQLLTSPDKLEPAVVEMIEANREHPFAAWLMQQRGSGLFRKGAREPWLDDDRTLQAFRVFEEDVQVELARRRFECLWLDQGPSIAGKARGAEMEKMFEAAYRDGKVVYLSPGTDVSLHSGSSVSSKQACLMVDWSEYLAGLALLYGPQAQGFIEKVFFPGVIARIGEENKAFVDAVSAAGCTLRGPVSALARLGTALRRQWRTWYLEAAEGAGDRPAPPVAMCLSLIGEWSYAEVAQAGGERHRFAFALAVPQASAGLSRDGGAGQLAARRDAAAGLHACGGVRVEAVEAGGSPVQLLHNGGFALTAAAVSELISDLRERASLREFRMPRDEAQSVLREFRLPDGPFAFYSVDAGDTDAPWLLLRVGSPCLAGVDVELFELLAPDTPAARCLREEGLKLWRGVAPS